MLSDEELLRYSRHLLLPQIDVEGQTLLKNSRVHLIGCGGLGNACALYLAASGVGHLLIQDGDSVEISNLQRQILFRDTHLQHNKASSAAHVLQTLNPWIQVEAIQQHFSLESPPIPADLIIDATDNFEARDIINLYALTQQVPLISGAAIGVNGYVLSLRTDLKTEGCYGCLFQGEEENPTSCVQSGVLGPMVGMMGSLMATLAIQSLLGQNRKQSYWYNWSGVELCWQQHRIAKDKQCRVCSPVHQ